MVEGRYGEFTVLVDDQEVVSAGPLSFLGVLPSIQTGQELVMKKLQHPLQGSGS